MNRQTRRYVRVFEGTRWMHAEMEMMSVVNVDDPQAGPPGGSPVATIRRRSVLLSELLRRIRLPGIPCCSGTPPAGETVFFDPMDSWISLIRGGGVTQRIYPAERGVPTLRVSSCVHSDTVPAVRRTVKGANTLVRLLTEN